ncbi:MAG: M48 family metallopeptidase [Burkholderiales bacterium]|nr:M48 family metallopeptidase [Burkholderiales bacterium]
MNSSTFFVLFIGFLLTTLILKVWLNTRHIRHIQRHRAQVPPAFASKISLEAHQKAADYTIAKTKFGLILLFVNAVVLLGFTVFGGLQWLSTTLFAALGPGMWYQMGLLVAFSAVSSLIDLPSDYYNQFVLEEKFGFNRMSLQLWLTDMVKNTVIGAVTGLPLFWLFLTFMAKAGDLWWVYAACVTIGFMFLMQVLWPAVFMPWFNKFEPMKDVALKTRLESLMQRVGFGARDLFEMDGSKRSGHGNAMFVGMGSKKRIVFYDTLMANLSHGEIEAILAHELGHFMLKHVVKRLVYMSVFMFGIFFLINYLKNQLWFYEGLGVTPILIGEHQNDVMALLLFSLIPQVFSFVFSPLLSIASRKQEYEADAFAAEHASADELISGLVKTYEENAATVTPDPLRSKFYDSHPPAALRIAHLEALRGARAS